MYPSSRAFLPRFVASLAVVTLWAACGTEESELPADSGTDAAADTSADAATDAATDTATDAAPDVATACTTPDPSVTCLQTGCGDGLVCQPTDDAACVPSTCVCGADGQWACSEDCGTPHACLPATDCPLEAPIGEACDADGLSCSWGSECCCGDCFASTVCSCEGGSWACLATDACMVPSCAGRPCASDDDCVSLGAAGVCVGGTCEDLSPAARCASLDRETCGTLSSVACEWVEPPGCTPPPDGTSLGEAGCFPSSPCASDADCGAGYMCEPQIYAAPECYWAEPLCDACVEQRSLCVARGV